MSADRRFLFAVHDVAPVHLARLEKVEKLIADLGISEVCYLVVPDFHGQGRADDNAEFVSWLHRQRACRAEWFLHGYFHLEDMGSAASGERREGLAASLKRLLLTAGEGEFARLDRAEIERRLKAGLDVYRRLFDGRQPTGFVAPAWLYNADLSPCLAAHNILITEDHLHVHRLGDNTRLRCPAITWATRTVLRKYGSIVFNPILLRQLQRQQVIRLAVHPHDFNHPQTEASIRRLLKAAMADRRPAGYRELFAIETSVASAA